MNTIEHEGQTYDVLTLDRISEITHAKLAGGKVVEAFIGWKGTSAYIAEPVMLSIQGWEPLGIQPLRLVPREPVTFEARATRTLQGDVCIWLPHEVEGKRFRCVEIVEEAKWRA